MAEAYFFNQTSFHHAETGFLTTPHITPPTLSQLVSELFSSCFAWIFETLFFALNDL
jgi:hypothetical protein